MARGADAPPMGPAKPGRGPATGPAKPERGPPPNIAPPPPCAKTTGADGPLPPPLGRGPEIVGQFEGAEGRGEPVPADGPLGAAPVPTTRDGILPPAPLDGGWTPQSRQPSPPDGANMDGGGLELLETPFCKFLDENTFAYLTKCNSVPAFLATLTLDLFGKQTLLLA